MIKYLIIYSLIFTIAFTLTAITETGEKVILNKDGTWNYDELSDILIEGNYDNAYSIEMITISSSIYIEECNDLVGIAINYGSRGSFYLYTMNDYKSAREYLTKDIFKLAK